MFGSCNFGKLHLRTHLRIQKSRENDWFTSKLHELYTIYFHSVRDTAFFHRRNRRGLTQTRAPAFTRANDTGHALTAEFQARRSRDTPGGACIRLTDGHIPRRDAKCPCRSRRLWRLEKPTTPRFVRVRRSRDHRGADTAPRRRLPRLVTAGAASAAMDRGRG